MEEREGRGEREERRGRGASLEAGGEALQQVAVHQPSTPLL
jgi:hypothetical protein